METSSNTRLRFHLDINLETDYPSTTIYPSVSAANRRIALLTVSLRLLALLTDEAASDEFCSIMRFLTEFILRRVIRLRRIIRLDV